MTFDMRNRVLVDALARYQNGRMSRRQLMRVVGGFGLGAVGTLAFGRAVGAHQEAGTPPAVATPVVGPQADGTTLWKVLVAAMDMENKLDFQGFFPGEITINAGDSIWFDYGMGGFHTVTFSGSEVIPIILPDPEAATPTAGPPAVMLNPQALLPSGGNVVDGSAVVNSGADVFLQGAPIVFTFSTPGTYDYYCSPHSAVMKAKVIVQEAGAELPTDQAGYDALAAEQIEALRQEGLAAKAEYAEPTSTARDDGTTLWEFAVGAGPGQARVMAILPEAFEIAVGDTIKFVIQSVNEPHTVSFIGAGEAPPEDLMPGAFADGSPKFSINPLTFLPQGGNVWSGTGWVNSGYMGIEAAGLPMEWECTFDTEGEYTYYCVLHGDAAGNGMASKLIVGPKA
jgi:plastocyanin